MSPDRRIRLSARVTIAAGMLVLASCAPVRDEDRPEHTPTQLAIVLVVLFGAICTAILVAGRWVARKARFRCQYCNRVVKALWDLPEEYQKMVIAHFHQQEQRTPDTHGIFLCDACALVYDDFSGEKMSRDPDPWYGFVAFCKVCEGIMYYCDPNNPEIKCRNCGTEYQWLRDETTNLRFLSPQGDVKILARAPSDRIDIY